MDLNALAGAWDGMSLGRSIERVVAGYGPTFFLSVGPDIFTDQLFGQLACW